MSTVICESIRVTILIISRFFGRQMVSSKKVHVQATRNFRLQKISQSVIKLMSHAEVVKDICDN
jgi:hypothetical protein